MTKFETKPLWSYNRLEAYDSIETTWPDKLCLSIMIWGGLLVSLLSFNFLEKPLAEEALANVEPTIVGDQKVVVDTVQDDALTLITEFEWLHTTSYWDIRRYSIWCGTYSHEWEVITLEEAEYRCKKRIDTKRRHYNLYQYDDHIEVALLSFEHNLWKMPYSYKWYIDNGYVNALWNQMKLYVNAGWVPLGWLIIRRWQESDLLTQKVASHN